ncbi:N-acetyltransferase [Lactiplantibacillus sp. WILCCON 0030]|uniref:N-acetyltransferase n=1 Tax=Lactiplantibacillus brownii TaxID=3069269 RepID=A0ABU1A957_9LACO|nr:N-acetyltransferase [Lactiplantibacillus brownii]MDQ7937449.1 N-acetyltransferase [Lactiplantibacillus brownii]
MLVKYRKDYEKVAMGLLSFIPDFKDIAHLQTEMQWYQADNNHQLLLWRQADGDFCGIIGIEVGADFILVHHDSLSPEERNPQNQQQMLDELAALYPDQRVMGTLEMAPIIGAWERNRDKQRTADHY